LLVRQWRRERALRKRLPALDGEHGHRHRHDQAVDHQICFSGEVQRPIIESPNCPESLMFGNNIRSGLFTAHASR
jgi:hypothetical protein